MKDFFKPGMHWLLVFIPVTLVLEYNEVTAPAIFFSAALSVVPLARMISNATEQLATYTGDAAGGLLNATFGNLPELIIAVVALRAGLHQIVLASLAGAILGNLLVATGFSFLIGGIKFREQEYNPEAVRVYGSMMLIAVISLTVPSAFHQFLSTEVPGPHENTLNILLSILLLIAYALYLVFMLKTHPDYFRSREIAIEEEQTTHWSMKRALLVLIISSALAAFMSELMVGAAKETGRVLGMSSVFIGVILLAMVGGAAESISAVAMAAKNKMDLSLSIAMGSSIQIALFLAPFLVLLSLVLGPGQMNLYFSKALIGALFLSVVMSIMVSHDGKSNWYEGVQLIIVYIILAIMFFFVPEGV